MILVLGGGFGLYGHLAALAADGGAVSAPARYRATAESRPELRHLLDQVDWIADEREAMARAETTVLVRRPGDNLELAAHALTAGVGGRLVIEKPIAPTWRQAADLEHRLAVRGRAWAVPYLFLFCDWYGQVAAAVEDGRDVGIDWSHRGSPRSGAWKRDGAMGGGSASFYFIHALALAEALRPGRVPDFAWSDGEEERITAQAANAAIRFTLGERMDFAITIDGAEVVRQPSPFGPLPTAGEPDPRISVLRRFYATPDGAPASDPVFLTTVTERWRVLMEGGAC